MPTRLRRLPRRTALTVVAAAAVGAVFLPTAPASAAATTWKSTVMGTVSTWHCSAELIAHVGSNGRLDASGQMSVHSAAQFAGHGSCNYQVVVSGTPDFRPTVGFNWFSSSTRTYTSGWFADNGSTTVQVCLDETYAAPHYATYHSGSRCTRSW